MTPENTTSTRYRKAVELIAGYVLPTYTFNEVKYVPLEFVEQMRQIARDAFPIRWLASKIESAPTPELASSTTDEVDK